jgi:hypothetical protein
LFTHYVDESTALFGLANESVAQGIPIFKALNICDKYFCSRPLIPEFLRIYGPQIRTVYGSTEGGYDDADEVAFYEALPNLTQLSTNWLEEHMADLKLPALKRLQLYTIPSEAVTTNFYFLVNFPNLTHLWLPYFGEDEYLIVMTALGQYFAIRNGWRGSSGRTLTVSFDVIDPELTPTEGVARLLQELAVADGRILIEEMPIRLLENAVSLFRHQQEKLRNFGKCIRSLNGFSSCLNEVELPNMRKLDMSWDTEGTKAWEGDYSRTVSWPKLEEVKIYPCAVNDVGCLAQLVFGGGVFRPSVNRVHCSLEILFSLESNKTRLGLANFPNLTHLTLDFEPDDVGLFRSLMRVLPTSCSKLQFLCFWVNFTLGDEDFLGVDEEGHNLTTTPPLLQLPGK